MQPVPITSDVVSSNLDLGEVFESHSGDTSLCDKVCQWLATSLWFSPGTPVSSTNKTDRHLNIVESGVKHHQTNKQRIKIQQRHRPPYTQI
jgi:hypothetical protein